MKINGRSSASITFRYCGNEYDLAKALTHTCYESMKMGDGCCWLPETLKRTLECPHEGSCMDIEAEDWLKLIEVNHVKGD